MKSFQLKIIKEAFIQGYNDACQGPLCEQRLPRGAARIAADYSSIVAAQQAARRRALRQFNTVDRYNMSGKDAIRKLYTAVGSGSDELIQNAFYYMLKQLRRGIGRSPSPIVGMIARNMQQMVEYLLVRIREGLMTQEEALLELYERYGQYLPRQTGEPGSGVISGGIDDFLRNVDPNSAILRLDNPSPEDLARRRAGYDAYIDSKTRGGPNIITPEGELSADEAEFLRRYQEFLDRFRDRGGPGGGSVDGP